MRNPIQISPKLGLEVPLRRLRKNPGLFASLMFPRVCRLPFSRLHLHIFARRIKKMAPPPPERRSQFDLILAPRGSAKSSLASFILPIHAAIFGWDKYIVLISATQRQAEIRLAHIRAALAPSGRIARTFSDVMNLECDINNRGTLILNGCRIDAFSAGSEIRGVGHDGFRPTWIILDDVETDARIADREYRDELMAWMDEVIANLGDGYTHFEVIGSGLHRDSVAMRLAARPDVHSALFRSIISEANRDDLWRDWAAIRNDLANPERDADSRVFFDVREKEMLAGAKVLWPEKETYYDLQCLRAATGRVAFDKEKQNAPPDEEALVFNLSCATRFRHVGDRLIILTAPDVSESSRLPPEIQISDLRVFGFLDPSLGGRDYAAIATVGVTPEGYVLALDVWLTREGPSVQIPRIFELHAQWNYAAFGVETNAFQALLSEPIESERARRKALRDPLQYPWMLPVEKIIQTERKETRIMGLEVGLRNGWLLLNEDLPDPFLNQLRDFPGARYDDGPDALAAATELARRSQVRFELPRTIKSARHRMFEGY